MATFDRMTTAVEGRASGWGFSRVPGTNRWEWSAYGPNGSIWGTAESASAARMHAVLAERDMTDPRTTEDR